MLATTLRILKSGLESDPTLSARDRARILASLKHGVEQEAASPEQRVDRLIRRKETAARLSCSLRLVDRLASTGVLPKRKLPGRVRASGFLESDVIALIAGRGVPYDSAKDRVEVAA